MRNGHDEPIPPSKDYVPGGTYPADVRVLRYALERHARAKPDETFAVFEGGERSTFAQTLQQVENLAGNLHELGVRQHDHVVLVLPTCPLALRVMFAAELTRHSVRARQSGTEGIVAAACAAQCRRQNRRRARQRARSRPRSRTGIAQDGGPHIGWACGASWWRHAPRRLGPDIACRSSACPAKTDPALGYAVHHLHLRDHRAFQGRVVLLHARFFLCRP